MGDPGSKRALGGDEAAMDEGVEGALSRLRMERLAEVARVGLPEGDDAALDARGQERLVAAVARGDGRSVKRRGALRRGVTLLAAAVVAAGVAMVLVDRKLDYVVEHAVATQEGYVAAPVDGEARLRFSDGSEVVLAQGASLRVGEVTSRGARVVLEGGLASVQIRPRGGARWSVEAGPFAIEVTGTAFDVAWAQAKGELVVHLREGSVVVRGPASPEGVSLQAGQRLVVQAHEGALQISSAEEAALEAAGDQEETRGAAGAVALGRRGEGGEVGGPEGASRGEREEGEETAADGTAGRDGAQGKESDGGAAGRAGSAQTGGREPGGAASEARSWSKRVADGEFAAVLAEAEARGLDAVLAGGSLDQVSAVADAARYAGRADVARRALVSMRRRFAASSQGKAAAFLLGRMADGGAPSEAIGWYDTYLAESPGGAFASEALGRKMMATQRTSGKAAARAIAERYLARYPGGAHASAARALVHP
ncbi:FecR family protein [Chondromyces crocatus]|uniref:FecR protein domain-containing protein n=1 Tax=Chondromyces crocatus TaxID=52 RepID=A0A0K1EF96_CHOCO|nr:FecR family protein [Chondromyces crocatus]AKT39524.1 uncharacterized protein CMC5_036710 [Chondromyces crocatus]